VFAQSGNLKIPGLKVAENPQFVCFGNLKKVHTSSLIIVVGQNPNIAGEIGLGMGCLPGIGGTIWLEPLLPFNISRNQSTK
jgi:hypothetical protein